MLRNLLHCKPRPVLIDPPCRRSPLSPGFVHPGLTMLGIHKCSSSMKFLNWLLPWLPVPALRYQVTDPVRFAVSAGPPESLLMALEMLLIASSLPFIAVSISSQTRCKESAIPSLVCCCNVIKSAVVAIPCLLLRCATAAAADLEGSPSRSTCDGAYQRSAIMSNGTLFCDAPCANANALVNCTRQICNKGYTCARV